MVCLFNLLSNVFQLGFLSFLRKGIILAFHIWRIVFVNRRLCYLQVKSNYIDALFLRGILLASFYFKLDWKCRILSSAQRTGIKLYFWMILNSQLTLLDSATEKLRSKWRKWRAVTSTSIFLCALNILEACNEIQTKLHLMATFEQTFWMCMINAQKS